MAHYEHFGAAIWCDIVGYSEILSRVMPVELVHVYGQYLRCYYEDLALAMTFFEHDRTFSFGGFLSGTHTDSGTGVIVALPLSGVEIHHVRMVVLRALCSGAWLQRRFHRCREALPTDTRKRLLNGNAPIDALAVGIAFGRITLTLASPAGEGDREVDAMTPRFYGRCLSGGGEVTIRAYYASEHAFALWKALNVSDANRKTMQDKRCLLGGSDAEDVRIVVPGGARDGGDYLRYDTAIRQILYETGCVETPERVRNVLTKGDNPTFRILGGQCEVTCLSTSPRSATMVERLQAACTGAVAATGGRCKRERICGGHCVWERAHN